jgi:hypothetical protein
MSDMFQRPSCEVRQCNAQHGAMPDVKCVAWTGLLRESLIDDVTNYRTAV